MSYRFYQKLEYDKKLNEEFQQDTVENVKEMCLHAYNLALLDPEYEKDYTHLVMETIKDLVAKKDLNKITFKQWKCLRAYIHKNMKHESIEDFLKS
jgi:hypothetical protein